jgi:hypothetical protein
MWLLVPDGFYSVVQRPGEQELCVRARDADDLTRLRERFMPELGETVTTPGSDYLYRAWIEREAFGRGLERITRDLTYPNFKAEVARRDRERAHIYTRVWSALGEIQAGGPYSDGT